MNYEIRKTLIMSPLLIFFLYVVLASALLPFSHDILSYKSLYFMNRSLGMICHKRIDRSFIFFGQHIYICTRCFAFYLTSLIILILFCLNKSYMILNPFIFYGLIFPLILDGTTQLLGFRESSNLIRVITGVLASIGVSPIIYIKYYEYFSRKV